MEYYYAILLFHNEQHMSNVREQFCVINKIHFEPNQTHSMQIQAWNSCIEQSCNSIDPSVDSNPGLEISMTSCPVQIVHAVTDHFKIGNNRFNANVSKL